MSMILDALRKSETQRRRAQAPDLFAELPPPSRRAAKRHAAVAVARARRRHAGYCRLGSRRGYWNEGPAGAPNAVAAVDARDLGHAGSGPSDVRAVTRPHRRTYSIPPVTMPTAATPAPATTAIAPSYLEDDASGIHIRSCGNCLGSTTRARRRRRPRRGRDPPVAEAPMVAAMSAAPPRPRETHRARCPRLTLAIEAAARAARARAKAEDASPLPRPPRPLRLSDLSTADRQQLPPLKISMHMWGPGARRSASPSSTARALTEGDRVGAGGGRTRSAADGVVLAWNGQRVKLPIR